MRTDSAEKEDWKLIQKLLTPPNALAAQIALKTGLRISDVLSIKTDQLKQRQFTVTEQKTGKKRRIFLNESLKEALRAQAGETFVFEHAHDPNRHRTRQAVYKDIKRAAKALRLDGNIAPHSGLRQATWTGRNTKKAGAQIPQHNIDLFVVGIDEIRQKKRGKVPPLILILIH